MILIKNEGQGGKGRNGEETLTKELLRYRGGEKKDIKE